MKLKAFMLSLMLVAMMLPIASFAQNDNIIQNWDDENGVRDFALTWTITNNSFGTSPLGSGLFILAVAGAGYAVARRRRNRKNGAMILLALAMILGTTGCRKKIVEPIVNPSSNGTTYTINLNTGNGSKVNVTGADVTFTVDDQILVAHNGRYVGALTYTEYETGKYRFQGTITTEVADPKQKLYFYFLGNKIDVGTLTPGTSGSTSCTVNISDQTAYPALPVISFSASNEDFSGNGSYSAALDNKCSLMKFNVTTSSSAAICITGMSNKVTVDFSKVAETGDGLSGSDTDNGFKYEKEGEGVIKMKGGGSGEKWAIVLPQDALAAGEAYSEDYYVGTRPTLSAISINQYLDSGVSMTVNSKWDGDLSKLSGSVSERYTTATDGMTITGTFLQYYNPYKISIAAGATVTLDGVDINSSGYASGNYAGLTCLGDAIIILKDGTTNTVKGFNTSYPGIHVPSGKTLTIQGTGTLNASSNSYSYAAGIGGGDGIPCGNIIINSGTITATCGGFSSAGIGGGDESSCGNITINGGTVTATGGDSGAGIGGGRISSCGIITISGGTVTATGGDYGAGIGSGFNESSCGAITINGGTVTATGGNSGAGIGGGFLSPCNDITISNTVTSVTATKGEDAYNSIGKGYEYKACGTVTIGGTVYYDGSSYQNDGEEYLSTSPLVYAPNPITPPTPPTPSGANVFTVSNDHGETTSQVIFSQGNLQYQASTGTWRFAANQYDYIGSDNSNISSSYSGWIDLFGWGTGDNPTKGYNDNSYNSSFVDWGINVIGSDAANTWRTLTLEEWGYIIWERPNANDKYAAATVNNVHGMVLLPDSWTLPAGCTFAPGHDFEWSTNTYNTSQWASMEAAGALFLPAAGYRNGTVVNEVGESGSYWTPLIFELEEGKALSLNFEVNDMQHFLVGARYLGCSVRLVKDAN